MIRKLSIGDIEDVIKLENAAFNETLGYDLLRDSINNPLYDFRVLIIDNVLVGYISTCFNEDFGDIYNFVIDEQYRNKGYGKLLLNSILEDHLGTNVTLEVRESNVNAINFYFKMGFNKIGMRKNYYSNHENAILLSKEN